MGQAQPIQGSWKDLDRFGKIPKLWRAWAFFVLVAGRCSWFNSKTLLPLLPAAILPSRNAWPTPWLQKDGLQKDGRVNKTA